MSECKDGMGMQLYEISLWVTLKEQVQCIQSWELWGDMFRVRCKLGGNPGRGTPKGKAEGDRNEQVQG